MRRHCSWRRCKGTRDIRHPHWGCRRGGGRHDSDRCHCDWGAGGRWRRQLGWHVEALDHRLGQGQGLANFCPRWWYRHVQRVSQVLPNGRYRRNTLQDWLPVEGVTRRQNCWLDRRRLAGHSYLRWQRQRHLRVSWTYQRCQLRRVGFREAGPECRLWENISGEWWWLIDGWKWRPFFNSSRRRCRRSLTQCFCQWLNRGQGRWKGVHQ